MAPSSFDSVEIEDVSEEGVVGVVGEEMSLTIKALILIVAPKFPQRSWQEAIEHCFPESLHSLSECHPGKLFFNPWR